MVRHPEFITVFILSVLVLAPNTLAINFGSFQQNYAADVVAGHAATFRIALWTDQAQSFPVSLQVRIAPKNFIVVVTPSALELSNNPAGQVEEIVIPGRGTVRAAVVQVFVQVPKNLQSGASSIVVDAVAGTSENQVSVLQDRSFQFTVNVLGIGPSVSIVDEGNSGVINAMTLENYTALAPNYGQPSRESLLLLIGIIIISVAAWIFYKKI